MHNSNRSWQDDKRLCYESTHVKPPVVWPSMGKPRARVAVVKRRTASIPKAGRIGIGDEPWLRLYDDLSRLNVSNGLWHVIGIQWELQPVPVPASRKRARCDDGRSLETGAGVRPRSDLLIILFAARVVYCWTASGEYWYCTTGTGGSVTGGLFRVGAVIYRLRNVDLRVSTRAKVATGVAPGSCTSATRGGSPKGNCE